MILTAARKISDARKTLVLDHPFWGALALRLEVVEDASCDTAWTDSVQMGYNPNFVMMLPQIEVVGLVAHEVGHCILNHCFRRDDRDGFGWNVACDFALNAELIRAGFKLPDGALLNDDFSGRSAEWIYDRLPQRGGGGQGPPSDDEEDGKGGQDDGAKQPPQKNPGGGQSPKSIPAAPQNQPQQPPVGEVRDAPEEAEADAGKTEREWRDAVVDAATMVKKLDGLDGGTERVVEEATAAKLDWRQELQRFAQEVATSDYSWEHMDERFYDEDIFVPALHSEGMGHLILVIDSSGSVDSVTLQQYEKEVRTIATECEPERTTVMYCDSEVRAVETYERGDQITLKGRGGGWTDFTPPFEWVEEHLNGRPAAMIYLTDLQPCGGGFPEREPEYPVLWAATGHRTDAPFGEVIKVE